jgi:hypothetical protein
VRRVPSSVLIIIVVVSACAIPIIGTNSTSQIGVNDSAYILVGGQNGTWFEPGQAPRLAKIALSNYSKVSLLPVHSEGTVWGGGWNGSQWLISGWGDDDGLNGSDPYLFLYDGRSQVVGGSLNQYAAEATWHGGDVFAASANGDEWLLSGLGSGNLSAYGEQNHMSLSTFDGTNFTDLSSWIPEQRDAILYANAWNGKYWLIGGGYDADGILFSFDGKNMVDLTSVIAQAVSEFGSVQSIAWNGSYWMIGGADFLATYDGHTFTDLTRKLGSVLSPIGGCCCCGSVNAIAWNGAEWMLGGGTPVAQTTFNHAWLVTYAQNQFTDLTSEVIPSVHYGAPDSSVLSITAAGSLWIIGGYSSGQGWLLEDTGGAFMNLSDLVSDFTYVNWVGVGMLGRTQASTLPRYSFLLEALIRRSSESWVAEAVRPRFSALSSAGFVMLP